MAEVPGYLIGPKLLAQIQSAVRHYVSLYGGGDSTRPRQQGQERLQVILGEDLLAAVDTLTDPSTAQANVLRRKANGDLEITSQSITIVNRCEEISIDAGRYAKAEWIDGEWQLYVADCPAMSASASVPAGGGGSTPPAESL